MRYRTKEEVKEWMAKDPMENACRVFLSSRA